VFFVLQAVISLLGDINWINDTIDTNRSRDAKVVEFGSLTCTPLKWEVRHASCVVPPPPRVPRYQQMRTQQK
jgi:hypothetical protein